MGRAILQHLASQRDRAREAYAKARSGKRRRRDKAAALIEATNQLLRAELARDKPARRQKRAEGPTPDLFAQEARP